MGLRSRLPLTSTAQPGAATLARALQPAQTAQLARRPTPDQPRSQRPWVGQLVGASLRAARLALVAEVAGDLTEQDHPQEEEADREHREDDVPALLGRRLLGG